MSTWLKNLARWEWNGVFSKDAPLLSLRYVVLDTELTSLDPRSKRMVSLGAIAMHGGSIRLGEQLYCVTNPGMAVPAETVLIHGLRPADVIAGRAPQEAAQELVKFAEGAVLVGHFLHIDLEALRKELPETSPLGNPAVDTARVQRWLDLRKQSYQEDRGHQTENLDLASLAGRYGLQLHEAHHALDDAFLTAQLWQRLLHALDQAGVRTLGRLLRVGRAS